MREQSPREAGGRIVESVANNRGKLLGVLGSCIIAWIYLTHGLTRALVVCAFLAIGYTVGARIDAGQRPVPNWIQRLGTRRGSRTR